MQDEKKKEAIFGATVKLVNEVGFASASIAKIAKAANVSPATIYIYYSDKQDLLASTFAVIAEKKVQVAMKGFDESLPIKESLRMVWINSFKFVSKHEDLLQYHEQFLNSPYSDLVDDPQSTNGFQSLRAAIESAAAEQTIKPVDFDLIRAFIFGPLLALAQSKTRENSRMTRKSIETAFEMTWDAIKLDKD
jgi:AcrR family transcriptional regulator